MEKLFAALESLHPISPSFQRALSSSVTQLSLPKDYHLLEAPKVAEHLFYLDHGFAFSYCYREGQKEVNRFWRSGSLLLSVQSLLEQKPSLEYIQLCLPSEVLFVPHSELQQLSSTHPEVHGIYQSLLYQEYLHSRDRLNACLYQRASQRYRQLLEDYPKIEQYVTQEHIATYLGITPQSLSRIKRSARKH